MMKSKGTILAFALLLACAVCHAQVKIYTMKYKMSDFTDRTTKVVVEGESMLALAVRETVNSHWRVSPCEFCTTAEYEALKSDNSYYFLRMMRSEGVALLELSKGGREDDNDPKKRPFEVISIPVGSSEIPSGSELTFMGAFIDIIQDFAVKAMDSDVVGYSGLKAFNGKSIHDKQIYTSSRDADRVMAEGQADAVAAIIITPDVITPKCFCYKMLIGADTHELLYYERARYKGPKDAVLSDSVLRRLSRSNGISSR